MGNEDARSGRGSVIVRLSRLPRQVIGRSPFSGTIAVGRVPLLVPGGGRESLPFPHPWNYREPLRILGSFFWGADGAEDGARHNRYLDVPGFAPVLVTRDPRVIRAISAETGDKPGQFDRDTMPSAGIARATGSETLLYANGAVWKHQKRVSTPPFARTTLFQPERFDDFERTFRRTVGERLGVVRARIAETGGPLEVRLEPEIKAIMLEMLVNNFFGAEVPYKEIRDRFVPALDLVIENIVRDTVVNRLGIPLRRLPALTRRARQGREALAEFECLTDAVLAPRKEGRGLWGQFKSEAPDAALRGNLRVFLAGALEATTSYAGWALAHLARHPASQERLYQEVRAIDGYTPETLAGAAYLGHVLDETLRLTPALYFHPRRATVDTTVETGDGRTLRMPRGTHILLDVWHANRHEDHWGVGVTGFRADEFAPERWERMSPNELREKDLLHFGFGHGPRFCPGKNLGQLEVALVVGACVKLFELEAAGGECAARAGVSTKPTDGVLVRLRLRQDAGERAAAVDGPGRGAETLGGCPFAGGGG